MRRFLVAGHRADGSGRFRLDDLPGSGGRMDIMAMAASSALFLSHGIREDAEVWLVMMGWEHPRTVRIIGSEARYLFPDERNMASMIRTALLRFKGGDEIKSTPGIYVSENGFREAAKLCSLDSELVYLKEGGEDIRGADLGENITFILGDSEDLTPSEEEAVMEMGARTLGLGNTRFHTYQAISAANYELDRRASGGMD